MTLRVQWVVLLLTSVVTWTSAVEMTASSWRCVEGNKATVNITSADCSCKSFVIGTATWSDVDCTRRNFDSFAKGSKLPFLIYHLNLSNNNITSLVESPFQSMSTLKELILSYNGMTSIGDNPFAGLEMLKVLDLSHNSLTDLPSNMLSNTTKLTSVKLSFNDLSILPPDLFNVTKKLESLDLSHNIRIGQNITKSRNALYQAFRSGLKTFELNHVNLTFIPSNFFNEATELQELHLTDNPLTIAPDLFIGSLQVLHLSGCEFERLETGNFISLPSLKDLYLDRLTNLTDVEEGAFEGLNSLKTLSIEKCVQLRSFHELAFGPHGSKVPPLKQLSLAQGGLQVFSPELEPVLKQVELVELNGNPWHCDCNLAWVLNLNLTLHEKKKLRCFSPPHLRAAHVFSLTTDKMVCSVSGSRIRSGLVIAMAVFLSLACMAMLIGGIDFIRRHRWRQARSVGRYQPIEVYLEANRAEYVCEDKDPSSAQTGVSVIQNSASH